MPLPFAVLTALYCWAIYLGSSDPDPPMPDISIPGMDKLAHMVLFGGLGALVSVGIRRAKRTPGFATQLAVPVLFVAVYGLSDEIHQRYVPGRTFDLADWAADIAGALLAQAVLFTLAWRGAFAPEPSAPQEG